RGHRRGARHRLRAGRRGRGLTSAGLRRGRDRRGRARVHAGLRRGLRSGRARRLLRGLRGLRRIPRRLLKYTPGPMKEETSYGGFGCVISAQPAERNWMPAGFPVASGFWTFREPDAVVIVQNDRLRVAAVPFTRSNDEMQFLDNAKHMYFSTRAFEAPKGGRLTVEWEMSATIVGA